MTNEKEIEEEAEQVLREYTPNPMHTVQDFALDCMKYMAHWAIKRERERILKELDELVLDVVLDNVIDPEGVCSDD